MTGCGHPEIVHHLGDGWSIAWDTTEIPAEVSEAFRVAGRTAAAAFAAKIEDEQTGD